MSGEPFSKDAQLARGDKREARHVADKDEWARIAEAKQGPCRVCVLPASNGSYWKQIELHHLVARAQLGDDTEDNIVPLCRTCHAAVSAYNPFALAALAASLTDSERAYVASKRRPGR